MLFNQEPDIKKTLFFPNERILKSMHFYDLPVATTKNKGRL